MTVEIDAEDLINERGRHGAETACMLALKKCTQDVFDVLHDRVQEVEGIPVAIRKVDIKVY